MAILGLTNGQLWPLVTSDEVENNVYVFKNGDTLKNITDTKPTGKAHLREAALQHEEALRVNRWWMEDG